MTSNTSLCIRCQCKRNWTNVRLCLCLWIYLQSEKISTILKAANVDVEPYWPSLFAKALEGINVKDLITNIGSGVGAAPAAGAAAAAPVAAAEKKEEKKKEESEEEEEDDDMGFGKFLAQENSIQRVNGEQLLMETRFSDCFLQVFSNKQHHSFKNNFETCAVLMCKRIKRF